MRASRDSLNRQAINQAAFDYFLYGLLFGLGTTQFNPLKTIAVSRRSWPSA